MEVAHSIEPQIVANRQIYWRHDYIANHRSFYHFLVLA